MPLASVEAIVRPDNQSDLVFPVGTQSDWAVACTAPNAVEADSGVVSGGKVVKPGAITRTAQNLIQINARGTSLLVALQYNSDVGTPTSPVVRVFGRDKQGVWHLLKEAGGSVEPTLTVATATDVVSDDGNTKLTSPLEFDLQGSYVALVAIQTAFAASSGTASGSKILVKLKSNR